MSIHIRSNLNKLWKSHRKYCVINCDNLALEYIYVLFALSCSDLLRYFDGVQTKLDPSKFDWSSQKSTFQWPCFLHGYVIHLPTLIPVLSMLSFQLVHAILSCLLGFCTAESSLHQKHGTTCIRQY